MLFVNILCCHCILLWWWWGGGCEVTQCYRGKRVHKWTWSALDIEFMAILITVIQKYQDDETHDLNMYHHLPMFVLRASATVSSVFMYLSPLGMVRSIAATKTTEPHSFWPILAALGNSTIWSAYGLLSYDIFPLFVTNFIGALLNFYYCRVFFQFEKKRILFLIASFILFSALVALFGKQLAMRKTKMHWID